MIYLGRDDLHDVFRYVANELGLLQQAYPETKIKDIDVISLVNTFQTLVVNNMDPDNIHSYDYRDKERDDTLVWTSLTRGGDPMYLKEFKGD